MRSTILPSLLIIVFLAGFARAIPNPAAVYCGELGYDYQIRSDEQGNQYGVCVFPDGSECSAWAFFRRCYLGILSEECHWPCEELPCKRPSESVLVGECCEGLSRIRPAYTYDAGCNELSMTGWVYLCSDCGNGICESWESICNCPQDCGEPRLIYVDDDAAGANNGSSWTDAYNHLQDALADANSADKPIEIRVAQGTYKPDLGANEIPGDRTATFRLIDRVTLAGGYAGLGSTDPNTRDVELYETVLSGDLSGNDIDTAKPRDLPDDASRAENSYHIVTAAQIDVAAVLDGFAITAGNANETIFDCTHCRGGGVHVRSSNTKVINCTLRGNAAIWGGAMNVRGGTAIVKHCSFGANAADHHAGALLVEDASASIGNCSFSGNYAAWNGGVAWNFDCAPLYSNCLFTGNFAGRDGGAIWNVDYGNYTFVNCTFSSNVAADNHGAIESDEMPRMINCIFWDNRDRTGTAESVHGYYHRESLGFYYCCVEDCTSASDGFGNVCIDPCFVNPGCWYQNGTPEDPNDDFWSDGNYHLQSQAGRWDANEGRWTKDDVTSPCIDAGDPSSPVGYEPFPNGGRINMGAYGGTVQASKSYFGAPVCETIVAGDINGDCRVDFTDLAIMALHWLDDSSKQLK